jgi:23S rRNA G2445 N2-methylase RlmL
MHLNYNFAFFFSVIAVDVNPAKIKLARQNAQIYGVDEKIDFRVGDYFNILDRVRADTVVTSLPWGRPGYSRYFDTNDLCSREAGGMSSILSMAKKLELYYTCRRPLSENSVYTYQEMQISAV